MEIRKTTLAEAGCIGVDAKRFGHGMETLFLGMSEIFTSLGVEVSEYVVPPQSTESKAKPRAKAREKSSAEEAPATEGTSSEADSAAPAESPTKPTKEAPTTETARADTASSAKATEPAPTKFTRDDITGVIVAKLKADRGNNEAIQKLLAANGVSKVSELQPDQFEAFMTALAQI